MDTLPPTMPAPDTLLDQYERIARSSRPGALPSAPRFSGLEPQATLPPKPAGVGGEEKPTVLVVDDDESIAELLTDLLSDEGYRVIVACDGREALSAARRERPAMILSDCMMPSLSGMQMVRELRRHPATRSIAVALMSSVRPRDLSVLDVPFLAKPFDIDDILKLVARCTTSSSLRLYGEG